MALNQFFPASFQSLEILSVCLHLCHDSLSLPHGPCRRDSVVNLGGSHIHAAIMDTRSRTRRCSIKQEQGRGDIAATRSGDMVGDCVDVRSVWAWGVSAILYIY